MSTPEDVAKWTEAVHQIMERDGVSEQDANAGLIWAVTDWTIQKEIEELAKDQANVDLWTSVIRDLQQRFPEWSEQETNDNLAALLAWFETHKPSAPEQRIPDSPREGPR